MTEKDIDDIVFCFEDGNKSMKELKALNPEEYYRNLEAIQLLNYLRGEGDLPEGFTAKELTPRELELNHQKNEQDLSCK